MPPDDAVKRNLVRQWTARAEEDLVACRILLGEEERVRSAVAFHAQQAAEKYLKALLTWHGVEFPKTHDLTALLDLVATCDRQAAEALEEVDELTRHAVATRYPGDHPALTRDDANRAIELAQRVRETVLGALPDDAAGHE